MRALCTFLVGIFAILVQASFPLTALAEGQGNKVIVFGKKIPQFLDDPQHSPFGILLRQLEITSGLDLEIRLLPAKRATSLFDRGEADILLPFPVAAGDTSPFDQFETSILASQPVAHLYRHILTLPPSDVVESPSDLRNLRVGTALGYEYQLPEDILKHVDLYQAADQAALVKMLYRKRVQAIVSFPFEAQLIARKLGLKPAPRHSREYILSRSDIVMLLHDTERGRSLLQTVNAALGILEKNGEIERLSRAFEEMPGSGS